MRRWLKRLAILAAVLAAFLLVTRAIVVPLARQRQERRIEDPTLVILVPAGSERWVIRRGYPGFPRWPEGRRALEARLAAWELPVGPALAALEIDALDAGEWLVSAGGEGGWRLAGRRSRLPRTDLAAALAESPDTLLQPAPGIGLRAVGHFFLLEPLADPRPAARAAGWLVGLPAWSEITDLLVGSDWLEFAGCGEGGALVGAKSLGESLFCEGLAWGCGDGVERLLALSPGPALGAAPPDADALDALPYLRRSPPFGPAGLPLVPAGTGWLAGEELVGGERRWRRGDFAATARVLTLPGRAARRTGDGH